MLNKNIEKMLVDQMNFELYSSYIYKAIAAYYDSIDLTGFSNWMNIQVNEENIHAEKLYHFICDRGGRPIYQAIPEPKNEWASPLEAFNTAYEHEKIVTERFNDMMTAALADNDHATSSFLRWFVDEQVEEEASTLEVVKKIKMLDGSPHGIYMLNSELGSRVASAPAQ